MTRVEGNTGMGDFNGTLRITGPSKTGRVNDPGSTIWVLKIASDSARMFFEYFLLVLGSSWWWFRFAPHLKDKFLMISSLLCRFPKHITSRMETLYICVICIIVHQLIWKVFLKGFLLQNPQFFGESKWGDPFCNVVNLAPNSSNYRNLTSITNMMVWKRQRLSKMAILGTHVKFWSCKCTSLERLMVSYRSFENPNISQSYKYR